MWFDTDCKIDDLRQCNDSLDETGAKDLKTKEGVI